MHRISRALLASALLIFVFVHLVPTAAYGQAAATAQTGKELTLERLFSPPFLFGRQTQGIEWAPDGKQFSYLDRQGADREAAVEMWTMNAATGERKVLVNAETLKKMIQPEKAKTTQATGLGRVQADNYFWSPDGNSLLFIGSSNLVLLDLKTMAPKPLVERRQPISKTRNFRPTANGSASCATRISGS